MNGRDKATPGYLTVGDLRKRIANLPDDAPVFYERIEDSYFEPGKGWAERVVTKQDPFHHFDNDYVQAFDAWPDANDLCLYISAHY